MSLPPRNVELQDSHGNIIAGFWQYGSVTWNTFFTWLQTLIHTDEPWAIFERHGNCHGQQRVPNEDPVSVGDYIILQEDGTAVQMFLTTSLPRPRQPTHSNSPAKDVHYRRRVLERDKKCLITGTESSTWSRLKEAHIFPRAHDAVWREKGFPNLIKDTASAEVVGGPSKIDSIQNIILLRTDLRDSWDNYEFGVNPDDSYRITAFVPGLSDVHGRTLHLDHIMDPTLRPLDELLCDHFMNGILKHVKGAGEPTWDYEDAMGDGAFDLSRPEVWNTQEGRERLEIEIADRLFEHRVAQDFGPQPH